MFNVGDCIDVVGDIFDVVGVIRDPDKAHDKYALKSRATNLRHFWKYFELTALGATLVPVQRSSPVSTTPAFNVGDILGDPGSGVHILVLGRVLGNTTQKYLYDLEWATGSPNPRIYKIQSEDSLVAAGLYVVRAAQPAMIGLKAIIMPAAQTHILSKGCLIVKSQALGKEFLYCKEHDEEADSIRCCRKVSS